MTKKELLKRIEALEAENRELRRLLRFGQPVPPWTALGDQRVGVTVGSDGPYRGYSVSDDGPPLPYPFLGSVAQVL